MAHPQVHVLAGSESDKPAMKKVEEVLRAVGVDCHFHIVSAHRNSEDLRELCRSLQSSDNHLVAAFIAIAGWAAALPGAVGAETGFMIPVIGVPLPGGPFLYDSLLSVASMPPGCPVMVVPDPQNAAIAAAQIVAKTDSVVAKGLRDYLIRARDKKKAKLWATSPDNF